MRNLFSGPTPTADDFTAAFTSQLTGAVDRKFPLKTLKCNHSGKPWIAPAIKLLIKDRQKAFHSPNLPLWRSLRHKVQQRKKAYYKNKVQHLRKDDCRRWWELELELYFYLNTVNLSDKIIIIKKITIYFNLYKHDLKI